MPAPESATPEEGAVVIPEGEETPAVETPPSVMDMDDAAFEELLATGELPKEEAPPKPEGEEEEDEPDPKPEDEGAEEDEDEPEGEELDTSKEEKELAEGDDPDLEIDPDKKEKPAKKDDPEGEEEEEAGEETTEQILANSEMLKEMFAPFKANGREFTVDNPEDGRKLMQMGVDYNKKMRVMKPGLKILKMLENNNLLDETKLSFLIDLDKKDPTAIAKLVKDAGIDTETLDNDADPGYKGKTYTVNDEEVELDETLRDIKDTDSYATTLDIISTKWDDASKAALLANPEGIKTINEHVSMGVFEKVSAAVERERALGRIPQSMSDLDAYSMVGAAINAKGGFDKDLGISKSTAKPGKPAAEKADDPKRNKRKVAAKTTRGKTTVKSKSNYNPLSMSDADFENTSLDKFI